MKNQTTKTEQELENIREAILTMLVNAGNNEGIADILTDRILELIKNERENVLEEVEENLPKADLEEARKHRPDNSVGFMLGWNAYSDKLKEKLAALQKEE